MRFELGLFSLASMALLLRPAAAVEIRLYRGSGCSGVSLSYQNVAAQACTFLYTGEVFPSIAFYDIPSGAKGQGYISANTCSAYVGEVGSGSFCLSSSGGFRSANWFYPWKKLVRAEPEPQQPPRISVGFEAPDGTRKEVEITSDEIELVLKLVDEEDYEALSKYPTLVRD